MNPDTLDTGVLLNTITEQNPIDINPSNKSQRKVPKFLRQTYDLLNDNNNDDIISWSADGLSIEVKSIKELEATVLPMLFTHNKFKTFVRQLHLYDFHKVRDGIINSQKYKNFFFRRDKPLLLECIKNKQNRRARCEIANGESDELYDVSHNKNTITDEDNGEPTKMQEEVPLSPSKPNMDDFISKTNDLINCLLLFTNSKRLSTISEDKKRKIEKLTSTYYESFKEILGITEDRFVFDSFMNRAYAYASDFVNRETQVPENKNLTNKIVGFCENEIMSKKSGISAVKSDINTHLSKNSPAIKNHSENNLLCKRSFEYNFDQPNQTKPRDSTGNYGKLHLF